MLGYLVDQHTVVEIEVEEEEIEKIDMEADSNNITKMTMIHPFFKIEERDVINNLRNPR